MAVPKKKTSKSKRNMRRAHDALKPLNLTPCPKCKAFKLPHSACDSCGAYKDIIIPKKFLNTAHHT